jgi:Na+-transporting NADH:ubiquinone oxidoreductase subunit NqrD
MYPMMVLMSCFVDSDWRLSLWFAVLMIVPCVVMERSRMRLRRKLPIEKWPDGLFF